MSGIMLTPCNPCCGITYPANTCRVNRIKVYLLDGPTNNSSKNTSPYPSSVQASFTVTRTSPTSFRQVTGGTDENGIFEYILSNTVVEGTSNNNITIPETTITVSGGISTRVGDICTYSYYLCKYTSYIYYYDLDSYTELGKRVSRTYIVNTRSTPTQQFTNLRTYTFSVSQDTIPDKLVYWGPFAINPGIDPNLPYSNGSCEPPGTDGKDYFGYWPRSKYIYLNGNIISHEVCIRYRKNSDPSTDAYTTFTWDSSSWDGRTGGDPDDPTTSGMFDANGRLRAVYTGSGGILTMYQNSQNGVRMTLESGIMLSTFPPPFPPSNASFSSSIFPGRGGSYTSFNELQSGYQQDGVFVQYSAAFKQKDKINGCAGP